MSQIARQALSASAMFGGSLKSAREAMGLSQASCARSMSVSKNCLHSLESGTDTRMSTALLALAMLGATMAAMRDEIGLGEAYVAEQAGIAPAVVREIEAGLSLDMPAVLALAQTYRRLIRRSAA